MRVAEVISCTFLSEPKRTQSTEYSVITLRMSDTISECIPNQLFFIVDSKTIREYYQILIDTLLGYFIYPYHKRKKREVLVSVPKFYLFDVGIAGYLRRQRLSLLKGPQAGQAFEHFILMEIIAYRGLNDLDFSITFWRTKTGLEVDFVLGEGRVAIAIKISDQPQQSDIRGLIAFQEEHPTCQALVVSLAPKKRKWLLGTAEITVWPWEAFLIALWDHAIWKADSGCPSCSSQQQENGGYGWT